MVYLNLCIIKRLHCSVKLGLFLTCPLFLINKIDMFFQEHVFGCSLDFCWGLDH